MQLLTGRVGQWISALQQACWEGAHRSVLTCEVTTHDLQRASVKTESFGRFVRTCRWTVGGKDAMEEPMEPCFVRAATDNDVGGSGGTSHAARWLQMGLDKLSTADCNVVVQQASEKGVMIQV